MKRLRFLVVAGVFLLLTGCETVNGFLFTYAAQGTQIEADRLVAKVYGLPGKLLPYGGPDIDAPLQRMLLRWPQLKAELSKGSIGLTDTGYVAMREVVARTAELKKLVRAENLDRQFLYRGVSEAVGHGGESLLVWIAYTEDSFASEWNRQAAPGWWLLDAEQGWQRKQENK